MRTGTRAGTNQCRADVIDGHRIRRLVQRPCVIRMNDRADALVRAVLKRYFAGL